MSANHSPLELASSPGMGTASSQVESHAMSTLSHSSYVIRLAIELDGEIIEERYVEPMEIVHIGHDQRSNLLCWGRLPRSVQLFEYDQKRQPVVLVSPRWLTQKNTHPLSFSPHSHPSQLPTIPTPLLPGQCFTLDLDGALLHIERQDFFSKTFDATHLDVPTFSPDSSSLHAPRVALATLTLCSLAYFILSLAAPSGATTLEDGPQLALAGSTMAVATASSDEVAPVAGAALSTRQSAPPVERLKGKIGHHLSWEEREVQRLLQSRSHHYRACFDASHEDRMMNLFFDLKVVPSANPKDPSSMIEHVDTADDANESHALLDCIVQNLHEVSLPRYERPFMVEFNILFEPSSP